MVGKITFEEQGTQTLDYSDKNYIFLRLLDFSEDKKYLKNKRLNVVDPELDLAAISSFI